MGVFGLRNGCVRIWGSGCVGMWEENVKKARLFGLKYVKVDVWEKFMRVCDWWNGSEKILIFFKV